MKKIIIALVLCFVAVGARAAEVPYTIVTISMEDNGIKFYKCKKHKKIREVIPIPLQGREYVFCLHCIVGGLRATIGTIEEVEK